MARGKDEPTNNDPKTVVAADIPLRRKRALELYDSHGIMDSLNFVNRQITVTEKEGKANNYVREITRHDAKKELGQISRANWDLKKEFGEDMTLDQMMELKSKEQAFNMAYAYGSAVLYPRLQKLSLEKLKLESAHRDEVDKAFKEESGLGKTSEAHAKKAKKLQRDFEKLEEIGQNLREWDKALADYKIMTGKEDHDFSHLYETTQELIDSTKDQELKEELQKRLERFYFDGRLDRVDDNDTTLREKMLGSAGNEAAYLEKAATQAPMRQWNELSFCTRCGGVSRDGKPHACDTKSIVKHSQSLREEYKGSCVCYVDGVRPVKLGTGLDTQCTRCGLGPYLD